MATNSLISVEEYLHTSLSPDQDYVDGELQERNLGEFDHGALQDELLGIFRDHRAAWQVRAIPELRVQVSAQRFRVPDLTILRLDHPREQIIQTPPVLCVEILSPEDRFGRMDQKIANYFSMGVQAVWVIDPAAKAAYECRGGHLSDWTLTPKLTVTGTSIEVQVDALFAALD